jgi:hypothetical protein
MMIEMEGENIEVSKQKNKNGRWSRDANGMLHYRGRCPFNNAMCRLVNRSNGAGSR